MGEVFKLNHCYNVDCLPAMELFPDNYFDLAVVDPPYFSGPERRGFYGSKVSKIGVHRDYPVSPAWSKPEPEYFRELLRVCRRYIVWGCNYFDYQFATGRIVWDKCNGNSSFFRLRDCGDRFVFLSENVPVYVVRHDAGKKHHRRRHHAGKQELERKANPPNAEAGCSL